MTKSGPDPDKECIFPFIYNTMWYGMDHPKDEKTYNACALDHIGRAWCPTKLDSDGQFRGGYESKNWGHCGYDCPLTDLPAGDIQTLFDYHVENKV